MFVEKVIALYKVEFSMQYEGFRFWLFFGALISSPIVVLLFLLNGPFIQKIK